MQQLNAELLNKFISDLYSTADIRDITIDNGLEYFYNFIRTTKTNATLGYYHSHCGDIFDFMKEHEHLDTMCKIKTQNIMNYINARSYLNNSTVNKRTKALRYVIKLLAKNKIIPLLDLEPCLLKETVKQIEVCPKSQLDEIEEYLTSMKPQVRLTFELLATTGIRLNELLHIERANIDYTEKSIYLTQTKNGNPRYCFLTDDVVNLIKLYLSEAPESQYLLCRDNGEIQTESFVHCIFKRIKKRLNIEKLNPHKLRHTYATNLIESGVDFETTRLLMGHSSYSILKRYIHIKNKKLREASLRFNPLTK